MKAYSMRRAVAANPERQQALPAHNPHVPSIPAATSAESIMAASTLQRSQQLANSSAKAADLTLQSEIMAASPAAATLQRFQQMATDLPWARRPALKTGTQSGRTSVAVDRSSVVPERQATDRTVAEAQMQRPPRQSSTGTAFVQRMMAAAEQSAPLDVFQHFVALQAGIPYSPVGGANCEGLSLRLINALTAAGHAGAQTTSKIGEGRYAFCTPAFIDPAWQGGVVMSDGAAVAGIVHFENHTAVSFDGRIYDPTCGYIGAEDHWFCAFENIDEIDGHDIPYDEDADQQATYWQVNGPLPMLKPYAKLNPDGTLVLMTAAAIIQELEPQPQPQPQANDIDGELPV